MRFVKDGPDVPDRLVQVHEEGQVVFFCGAGISYPAGLPGFDGLGTGIFESLGESPNSAEQVAIKGNRFDAAIDLLERRIRNRALVREKVRTILTPKDLSTPEATATHRALLTLAKARDGQTRLVTTNFDRIFCTVEPKFQSYAAPLLPIPKRSRWHGLVYLHGLLPEDDDSSALNNLVVSSGDFGLAYLTERWASRFVTELFRGYTVCFVGYSIGDPVLRYMLDALSADRLMGETTQEVFAFGSFKGGSEAEAAQDWNAKGVMPILYDETKSHALLHKTLQEWSEVYRDGLTGKRAIITREAAGLPSPIQGDGQISRVLWAITDPSGQPAKAFAELDPVPPVEWLAIFTEPRYAQADLPRFGITPAPSKSDLKAFSLLNHPAPYQLGPWLSLAGLVNTSQGPTQVDVVMFHIARWVVRHLDKPEVLRWALANGSALHPTLCHLISDRLKAGDLPRPLVTIWRLICAGFATNSQDHLIYFNWKDHFKQLGLTASLRAQLRDMLRPCVRFREPFRLGRRDNVEGSSVDRAEREPRIKDYVDWDISLSAGEHPSYWLDEAKKLPGWPKAAVAFLSEFTTLLRDTMDLMAELEGALERSDISYLHRPSIGDHSQNTDFHEWTILIELCRDAWLLAVNYDPRLARAEIERWKLIKYPLFRRLVFFAAANSPLVPESEGLPLLLEDEAWWLWSVETRRESFRLLVWLASKVDENQLADLCKVILAGPPRPMFRDNLEVAEWNDLVDDMVWLRLEKLRTSGAALTPEAERRRLAILAAHTEWHLQPEERDEFSTWMESGRGSTWRKKVILPRERRQLADALATRPSGDHWYEDDWREICQTAPEEAVEALRLLASENNWPIEVWRDVLQVFSEEKLIERSWVWLEPILLRAPNEAIRELLHTLSWWVQVVAKVVPKTSVEAWLRLIDRMLDCTTTDQAASQNDPVAQAINHPVGHAAEALIQWWYRMEPQAGERLPEPLKIRLNRLAGSTSNNTFVHGRVIMAAHLNSLFLVDPDWTAQNVLPCFDWQAGLNEAKAAWNGYLWSPRINAGLLDAFKLAFLATAHHYCELGEHGRQYASLLTVAALELRQHFSAAELRDAFNALPHEGLAEAATMLARALSDAGNQREEYWTHRVKPLLLEVWPKSADRRSGHESVAFAELCVRAGAFFQDAVRVLQPYLVRVTRFYMPVKELAESELANRYPAEALRLLDAIVDEGERWPPEELAKCLEQLSIADSSLRSKLEYRRLQEYLQRQGQL
jgi:hypothetical protein